MRARLLCLGLLMVYAVGGGCAPATAPLNRAQRAHELLDRLETRPLLLDFELAFDLVQAGRALRVLHAGQLAQAHTDVFRMDASTEFRLLDPQLAGANPVMQQVHAADGLDLWVENRMGEATAVVISRPLAHADFDAAVDASGGVQQLSPLDVHPLRVLRASLATVEWRAASPLEAEGEVGGELWVADLIPEDYCAEFPHLRELFQPKLIRFSLDAETGLPQWLQLIDQADQLRYEARYFAWTFGELAPGRLDYSPPEDVQVIRQAPAVGD